MQADSFQDNISQSVKSDFTANGKIISLLNFLELHLPNFSEKMKITKGIDERILNQKLLRFFTGQNSLFVFIPENLDENRKNISKPDFGVYEKIKVADYNQQRFFDIECKRLYDKNKKEYVWGKTGGIQRFKENKHGVDLPFSAMIGYVEIENFDFWHKKVNSWILDKEERLKLTEIYKIAKLKSTHIRNKEKTKIALTHFWLSIDLEERITMAHTTNNIW